MGGEKRDNSIGIPQPSSVKQIVCLILTIEDIWSKIRREAIIGWWLACRSKGGRRRRRGWWQCLITTHWGRCIRLTAQWFFPTTSSSTAHITLSWRIILKCTHVQMTLTKRLVEFSYGCRSWIRAQYVIVHTKCLWNRPGWRHGIIWDTRDYIRLNILKGSIATIDLLWLDLPVVIAFVLQQKGSQQLNSNL